MRCHTVQEEGIRVADPQVYPSSALCEDMQGDAREEMQQLRHIMHLKVVTED